MVVANLKLCSTFDASAARLLVSPKKLIDPSKLLRTYLLWHLLVLQIRELEQKFYFHSEDWRAILTWDQLSHWQITSASLSPLWAALTFFTQFSGIVVIP